MAKKEKENIIYALAAGDGIPKKKREITMRDLVLVNEDGTITVWYNVFKEIEPCG